MAVSHSGESAQNRLKLACRAYLAMTSTADSTSGAEMRIKIFFIFGYRMFLDTYMSSLLSHFTASFILSRVK